MKVRFAVSAGARPPVPDVLHHLVTTAEELGIDTLWFSDLTVLESTDPLLSVAMAAAWTTRIKLGITIVPFGYEPFVFARQLAQLDQMSAGRLRVMLVPGLEQQGERRALGIEGVHRSRALDRLIPVLRGLWAGEPLLGDDTHDAGPALPTIPAQQHLQIWLAGRSEPAYQRVARIGDGWRGGGLTPTEASQTVRRIQQLAADIDRTLDPGHFGLTITYARQVEDFDVMSTIHGQQRTIGDPDVVPVGRDHLRTLVGELIEAGLTKFSLRRTTHVASWDDELAWLADAVLDLQT